MDFSASVFFNNKNIGICLIESVYLIVFIMLVILSAQSYYHDVLIILFNTNNLTYFRNVNYQNKEIEIKSFGNCKEF